MGHSSRIKHVRAPIHVTCRTYKHPYRSRKLAASVAARVRREGRTGVVEYHCGECHCWHIGHQIGLNTVPTATFNPATGRN